MLGVVGYAYQRIGLSAEAMGVLLAGCILGSRVNIPLMHLRDRRQIKDLYFTAFGTVYRVPVILHSGRATLSVNLGGAVIPAALAVYLTAHDNIWKPALMASAVMAAVVRVVARPVPGVGIVTPALVPPIAAALTASLVGGPAVAAVAYVCGTIGTLVGADLLNLSRIRDLGGPVFSIGGAGTFDGIFLTGILAVLLAA
jgi:uncharacterized membrane protein